MLQASFQSAVVVLLAHKYLRVYSGAETVHLHSRNLLLSKGHEVVDFTMRDARNVPSEYERYFARNRVLEPGAPSWRRARDGVNAVYSLSARRALARLLDDIAPDVAHLHSVQHQLSLAIIDELADRSIPIVLTVHDYKVACPSYTLFTEGAPCRRCVGGSVRHAIRHRCVQNSIAASTLAAAEAALVRARHTYHKVSRFLAPSAFTADIVRAAGIPASRIQVLPYFLPDEEIGPPPSTGPREPIFLYAGRLHETKGVTELLEAFARVPAPARLRIAGFGPLEDVVVAAAAENPRVEYLGRLDRKDLLHELSRCRALVLPSIWEDNAPVVILEAQARGTPAIVSNRGGPPEFVGNGTTGFVVDPTNRADLAAAMRKLSDDPGAAAVFGASGRQRLLKKHTSEAHYSQLMEIYAAVTEPRSQSGHARGNDKASASQ